MNHSGDENPLEHVSDRLFCVIGPSASGKTAFALQLAGHLRSQGHAVALLNIDVMQMYDGLPIVTNKPTVEELNGFPHYFIGHLTPFTETRKTGVEKHYGNKHNIVEFIPKAISLIRELQSTRTTVILTGGTLYYVQSILTELVGIPSDDSEDVTAEKNKIRSMAQHELHEHLRSLDPDAATRWHPNDYRHIRRSIEVYYEKSQSCIASQKASLRWEDHAIFCLDCPDMVLNERIEKRAVQMDRNGICAEVTNFYLRNYGEASAFDDAIGFKEFLPYFTYLMHQRTLAKEQAQRQPKKAKKSSWMEGSRIWETCLLDLMQKTKKYCRKQTRWIRKKFLTHPELILFRFAPWNDTHDADSLSILEVNALLREPIHVLRKHPKRVACIDNAIEVNRVQFCEPCGKYLENREQWKVHTKSRRHQSNVSMNAQRRSVG